MIIDFKERSERIKARQAERRAGGSEHVARAALHGLGLRGEELRQAMAEAEPVLRSISDSEDDRYKRSVEWLREFLSGER